VHPEGLRKALNKIKNEFGNPEVIITENGVSDKSSNFTDSINDYQRVEYYYLYINEVLKAVNLDGCNVKGYIGWSLLDGFEWAQGYT
jgi:beta-glucosidase/6-phospho-beta-glucosidase/beta-galactosidase